MGDSLGLCVLDAQISSNDNGPVLEAQLWRLGLDKHEASWDETSMLEFYWETEIADQAGFWLTGFGLGRPASGAGPRYAGLSPRSGRPGPVGTLIRLFAAMIR